LMLIDLRDFTMMSDTMNPRAVVRLLNDYFDDVIPPIREHGGEVRIRDTETGWNIESDHGQAGDAAQPYITLIIGTWIWPRKSGWEAHNRAPTP